MKKQDFTAWRNKQRQFWIKIRRLIGALLIAIGIASLIYASVFFFNTPGGERDMRGVVFYSVLSLPFFIPGIILILIKRDKPK
jgi:hypothetical protein